MEPHLASHIEALIFASDRLLTSVEIIELINASAEYKDGEVPLALAEAALQELAAKYSDEAYPFEIVECGGGWQFLTKKKYYKTVAQLTGEKFLKRLSAASLETMAIIAYKQPITKGEIELIRGVSSDYSIQKLLEKELIIITGRNETLPGKPLLYATSKNFMDYFGINSPEELPKIREVLPDQPVMPTVMQPEPARELVDAAAADRDAPLVVRGNGELVEEAFVVDEDTEAVDPADALHTDDPDDAADEHAEDKLQHTGGSGEGDRSDDE